ncbi:MAG: polysaccharide pyruvyl transferase family protein [Lachnospiraceae bacterium]|nr:polysaccharide pyruvyl transferase family protein [Lachnospiraceae bacterium]
MEYIYKIIKAVSKLNYMQDISVEKFPKKRAAIVTWCDNNGKTNYGQVLQCYAMQQLVNKWGYDSFVVQYRTKNDRDFIKYNFSNRNPIGRWLNELYQEQYKLKVIESYKSQRVSAFRKFVRNYIRLTSPCYTREAVEYETKDCQLLVCGSDQIWNPLNFHPIWMLNFGAEWQKRVAYAPSGIFCEDEENVACYKRMALLLENLDVITLREQLGVDILSKYTNRKMRAVLDPTLLMNCRDWDKIAVPRLIHEKYIFCYVMGSIRPHQLLLRNLKEKHYAKKIVYIPSNLVQEGQFSDFIRYDSAGPAEFISLIKYAEAVCTDSFHGTTLSIVYEKQFYNLKRVQEGIEKFGGSERIDDLLIRLNISSRALSSLKEARDIHKIEYDKVNQKLERLKKESIIWKAH